MNNWVEANQRYLLAALSLVRDALERSISDLETVKQQGNSAQELDEAMATMPGTPALTQLCTTFDLSPFERDILLLCAGMDLDGRFAALCSAAHNRQWNERSMPGGAHATLSYPTFSLALAALPHPHWDALTPAAPLRRWQLITVGTNNTLTLSPLRIDEHILHYLAGVSLPDERLAGIIIPVASSINLAPSHKLLAQRLIAAWSPSIEQTKHSPVQARQVPVVQLCGEDPVSKSDIAALACTTLGLHLRQISASALPTLATEIETLARLWEREAALNDCALLLDCADLDTSDAAKMTLITRFVQQISCPLIITANDRFHLPRQPVPPILTFDVGKLDNNEQRIIWQNALDAINLNGHVDELVAQFNLNASTIHTISNRVLAGRGRVYDAPDDPDAQPRVQDASYNELSYLLWDACRAEARPRLDDLAQRIEPRATWDNLVLPVAQQQLLREIATHVRQRTTVYESWGFNAGSTRGLGISVLFAGASGTGKTLAAEVLAHELRLDLYRIDLSSVVSKYIGETEKNLRRVFDAAEEAGTILLFDEADALFGKRSEVKDSHDRYANIEVSYLLQRMEVYRGLAILTTNLKSALDTAFLRRIRFVVQFPFPDATQRAEIWQHILPRRLPTENLDMGKLARLNIAGGNIRNIALNAAFLAADAHEPVRMTHMLRAAYTEYTKLEKPLTEAEIGGWL